MFENKKPLIYYLRLVLFGSTALVATLVVIDLALGWMLMSWLTSPPCFPPQDIPKKYEENWLTTSDGIRIRSWYTASTNGAVIIIMGGTSGSIGDRVPITDPLIEAGFGVVQIDTRACAKPKAKVTLGAREVFDAYAALDFLLEKKGYLPENIGIYGFSMGGVSAIRAAATRAELHAVVAEGGYAHLGEHLLGTQLDTTLLDSIIRPPMEWAYRAFTEINPAHISTLDEISKISPRPVYLIYGESEVKNGRGMEQFTAAMEPKQFWLVPGGSHGKNHLAAPGEYDIRIIRFFENVLLTQQE